ncbi:gas vesicle protein GvpR [Desulfocucumis palustris]|uniref:Gas vesicle protein GvpR n=1 Tax=Desulfocucumis palustris TaxID=1898651 RepID=A0A2L2X8K5_9FIRM|nr:gas vesicle protein GvpO [Desulfocucumis palustris]GBF32438.1 gas vesicle protein GvpR [Desulfocucumis palustris]
MIEKVIDAVQSFFVANLNKQGSVIGVKKDGEIWRVQIEVAEDVEYMRKRARDDLMAIYEVGVGLNFQVTDFERKAMRPRDNALNT